MAYLIETEVLRRFELTLDDDNPVAVMVRREIARREAEAVQRAKAEAS